jgi:hypothetical protein
LETKITIKMDGWNQHSKDKIEGQNQIQKPYPPIEIKK